MAGSSNQDSPSSSQFENHGIIGRYEYVNTGKRLTAGSNSGANAGSDPLSTAGYVSFDPQSPGVGANQATGHPTDAVGVYAAFPMMTPKYARHPSNKNAGHLSGLARMYIPVGSPANLTRIIKSLGTRDPQLVAVAKQLLGASAGKENTGKGYIDFILTGVSQTFSEKYQVSEVLEDNYAVFFFGQRAPIWSFSGSLMNTYQDDWTMNMLRLYSELGRGSQLAKRGLLLHVRYDSLIVAGGMINFQWDLSATNELYTAFSFQFLVRSRTILRGSRSLPTNLPDYYSNFYDTQLNQNSTSYLSAMSQSEWESLINEQKAQSPEGTTSYPELDWMTSNEVASEKEMLTGTTVSSDSLMAP